MGFQAIGGESLNGLLGRYNDRHRIDRLIELTADAGVQHAHKQRAATLGRKAFEILASATGIPVVEFETRSLPADGPHRRCFNGISIRKTDIDLGTRLFAPASLASSPHHRSAWMLRAFPFCSESWQFLLATCHRCGAPQQWYHTVGIAHCGRCLADLRRAPAQSVHMAERNALALAVGFLDYDPATRSAALEALPVSVQRLGADGAYELLILLVLYVEPTIAAGRVQGMWSAPKEVLTSAIVKAYELLSSWPSSVRARVRRELSAREVSVRSGDLKPVVRLIASSNSNAVLSPVRDEISDLAHSMSIYTADAQKLPRTIGTRRVVKLLNKGPADVAEWRRGGTLRTIHIIGRARTIPLFDADEVEAIATSRRDRIDLCAVAWRWGISTHGVEQLVALGCFEELTHPWFERVFVDRQIRLSSVEAFVQRLLETASATVTGRPLRTVMRAVPGRKPWGPALLAIADGSIRVGLAATGPIASRLIVPDESAREIVELRFDEADYPDARFAPRMTLRDLEETLGTHPRSSATIASILGHADAAKRGLPVVEVNRLAAAHISLAELAARTGLNSRTCLRELKLAGLKFEHPLGASRREAEAWLASRLSRAA